MLISGGHRCVTIAMPRLGDQRVSEITSADVLGVLTPIWNEKAGNGSKSEAEDRRDHALGGGAKVSETTIPRVTR